MLSITNIGQIVYFCKQLLTIRGVDELFNFYFCSYELSSACTRQRELLSRSDIVTGNFKIIEIVWQNTCIVYILEIPLINCVSIQYWNYFFLVRPKAPAVSHSRRLSDGRDTVASQLQTLNVLHNLMSKNLNYSLKEREIKNTQCNKMAKGGGMSLLVWLSCVSLLLPSIISEYSWHCHSTSCLHLPHVFVEVSTDC